jgi:hypothetical protein
MHTIFVHCNYYKIFELSHISEGSTTLSYLYIVTQYFHLVVRYKCKLKYSHTFSENLTTLSNKPVHNLTFRRKNVHKSWALWLVAVTTVLQYDGHWVAEQCTTWKMINLCISSLWRQDSWVVCSVRYSCLALGFRWPQANEMFTAVSTLSPVRIHT